MRGQKRVEYARERAYDPRIHLLRKKSLRRWMDCRVKPGNDNVGGYARSFILPRFARPARPLGTQPAAVRNGHRGNFIVSGLLFTMKAATPTCRAVSSDESSHDDAMTSRSRQDLFLRSRISANTFHAGLPASPTDFATSGTSARRNGFAAFSAPMVDGMVGSRAARSLSTSVARARSAALSGSTVLAKATLALVYSWPQ